VSALLEPEFPALPPAAVDLLTAIRDHLDLPLPAEQGTKKDRKKALRKYRGLLDVRHADVVAALNDLLAVPLPDVAEHAAQLRRFAAEEDALSREMEGE
jgi:hypothetical protein